jgi:flagellar hook-associated protein 2
MPTINFSGLASGIDTNALISASSDATRKEREAPDQTKVSQLTDTDSALTTLKTKLVDLQTKIKNFASLNGGALSKDAQSTNESIASAAASNAATNGTYTVNVTQLAKNATYSFDDRFADSSTVINAGMVGTQTVTVTVGSGANMQTVNVDLTNTSTVSDFISNFNSTATNAQASLVNVGTDDSPSYGIMITSLYEGTSKGLVNVTVPPGVGALASATSSQATDSQITVSGINGTITRSTNSVADIIPGVTFNLAGIGTTNVTITDDVTATTSKVQDFIDSFNDLVSYVTTNNQITRQDDGTNVSNVFSPLASTRVDDNALSSIRDALAGTVYAGGSAIRIMADLGISTQEDGTLAFNTTTFASSIAKESSSVNNVLKSFADTTSLTGGTIDGYVQFNGMIDIEVNSNETEINDLNQRISEVESQISKTEDDMRSQFANLESTMSKLQSQQQSLTSALAGLGK